MSVRHPAVRSLRTARSLRIGVVALALAAALAAQVTAANATTTPGVTAAVPVMVTSTTIKIAPDKYTQKATPDVARYPRGATVTFVIRNQGTVPVKIVLRVLTALAFVKANHLKPTEATGIIKPTRIARLKATFAFRGNYELELVRSGKIVVRNSIVIS